MPAINLNQDQREAVKYFSRKPLLIQAGPGSGKTRVIIERVKYLIQEKISTQKPSWRSPFLIRLVMS